MPDPIVKFVKNSKGHRVGVVVATRLNPDVVGVGWSRCMTKVDEFDRQEALTRALERAKSGECIVRQDSAVYSGVAPSMEDAVQSLGERAHKYFWPNHGRWTAPDGRQYRFTYRPRLQQAIVYADDLTPVLRFNCSGESPDVIVESVEVNEEFEATAAPDLTPLLGSALDEYLRNRRGLSVVYSETSKAKRG